MADPLASTADLEAALLRSLTQAELPGAVLKLSQASAIVRLKAPTIDTRIAAEEIDPLIVAAVVAEMVARVLRNPEGLSEYAIDDARFKRSATTATGQLYVTAEELRALLPRRSSAGSVALKQWWAE